MGGLAQTVPTQVVFISMGAMSLCFSVLAYKPAFLGRQAYILNHWKPDI